MSLDTLLIPTLIALCAFLVFYALADWIWAVRDPARRGMLELAEEARGARDPFASVSRKISSIGSRLLPVMGSERTRIKEQLYLAGYRRANASAVFVFSKFALVLAAALAIWALSEFATSIGRTPLILLSAVMLATAFLLPNWWLTRRVAARQAKLRNAFPDALDMLVICVEAGLGLTSALERVTEEIRHMHPELAMELAAVNAEMRSGVDRATAFRSLNVRTGLPEIRGFVSLLVQTLQLGTGIASSLRIFAEEFRDQRMQKAEERAAKIGTKMVFPLVFCEFPVFFLIAVGPATLRLFEAFEI